MRALRALFRARATAAVLLLCTAAYALQTLHKWEMLYDAAAPLTWLAPAFQHANILHLAFNLYWLVHLGPVAEQALGGRQFLAFVAVTAIASNAAQYYASGPRFLGLSGVVYALVAFLWVAQPAALRAVAQFFAAWFCVCVALTAAGVMRVGNASHGAGALAGYLLGRLFFARQTN